MSDEHITLARSLEIGQNIQHFEILEVFPLGGFGVTYRAWDSKLNREVAIKEYFPEELASRKLISGAMQVCSREGREAEFTYRLQQYLDEARVLASFNHPNIIKVYDFFEASGTAYIVMEYAQGLSLKALLARAGVLSQHQCLQVFTPILEGLAQVHGAGFLHRDIKPDNIYVRDSGEPVLIDFGAAREHQPREQSKTMTTMVSLGYAPPEQYSRDSKWLGPWSDLYSIGASLYHCVNGNAPEESTERQTHFNEDGFDPLKSASQIGNDSYGSDFLVLVDWLLELRVKKRPQSVADVLHQIAELAPQSADLVQQNVSDLLLAEPITEQNFESRESLDEATKISARAATVFAPEPKAAATSALIPSRYKVYALLGVCVLCAIAGIWWGSHDAERNEPDDVAAGRIYPEPLPEPQFQERAQVSQSRGEGYQLVATPEADTGIDNGVSDEPHYSDETSLCEQYDSNAAAYPDWEEGKVYTSGNKVSHLDLVWSASWWTQSQEPGRADVWKLQSSVELPWMSSKVYNGGDEANHSGRRFRAKWWSQGDTPDSSEVWVDIGPASCG